MWSLISLCLGLFRGIEAVFNHLDNSSAKLWELGLLWSEISNCVWRVAIFIVCVCSGLFPLCLHC